MVADWRRDLLSAEAQRQLQLLGKDPARAWFRTIRHRRGANISRRGGDLHGFDADALAADNAAGDALYVVIGEAAAATGVNKAGRPTGAVCDGDIETFPCLFVEWDEGSLADQQVAWQRLGLPEPTLMLTTGGKSIHAYWRLREPVSAADWKVATARLIEHCQSDSACSNPSRVMRLAGSAYIDKATGKPTGTVAEIVHAAPEALYNLEQVMGCIPAPEPVQTPPRTATASTKREDRSASSDLPPRPPGALLDALRQVPQFRHGAGQYQQLLGLALRLRVEVGRDGAIALLRETCCRSIDDLDSYFSGADPTEISSGSVWPYLRDQWRINISREDLKRPEPTPPMDGEPFIPDDAPGNAPGPQQAADKGASFETSLSDLFPDRLAMALQNRCRYLPAGPAAIAVTFLAGIAGCVKLGTRVVGSEAAGFNVPATLYTAVVAGSGYKKSPLGGLVITEPTTRIREDLREQTNRDRRAWLEQQKGEGKGKQKRPAEPEPRPMLLTVSEVTGEGLAVQLAAHEARGVGLLIHRDEIAGLIGGLNQYKGNGKGNDQQQLLEAFDGRGSVALRVKSDAPRACERCQLAIHGGIQPAVLRALVDRGDDSGLWARFLFAPLPATVVPLPEDDPEQTQISHDAAQALTEVVDKAYRLPPRTYRLDWAAGHRFRSFELIQQRRVHDAEVDAVSAIAGKAAGKVLRVAVLLHVIAIAAGVADPDADVPLARIEAAISLVTYCDGWVAGLHEAAAAGDDLDAGALVLKLAGQRCVGWNDLKHRLSRKQRLILPNVAAFTEVVRQLAAEGKGVVTSGQRGGVRFQATP